MRLTASEVVSCEVLSGLLAELAQRQPQIQVERVPGDTLSNLLDREADIAVRMLRPTQGTLITRHIATGRWASTSGPSCWPRTAARPRRTRCTGTAGSASTSHRC